jgi:O-antigen/teichoic acid export membrane protein
MSKIGTPEIIGTASAVITFSGILAVISHLGIPTGIQRFLGRSFAVSSIPQINTYLAISTFLVTITISIVFVLVTLFGAAISDIFKISHEFLVISIVLMISTCYATFFRGVVVSSLQTKILTIAMTVSAIIKLILGILFVLGGLGAYGLIISFTVNQCIVSVILAIHIIRTTSMTSSIRAKSIPVILKIINIKNCKEILSSSIVYWVPLVITTIGSQIGTIFIYRTDGSADAGLFFIALTIVTGITSVMYSLFTISFPALSAMDDGRKRFTKNTIRLSLIIALPFSTSLIFYSEDILGLLGPEYVSASSILDILLLAMFPTAVQYGITSLVYSYGNYRQVLFLGLATSLPRITLYFVLIPLLGGVGGAIAYTIGSLVGFVYAAYISKKNRTFLQWRRIFLIFVIPIIVSYIITNLNISYVYGTILNLCISYIIMYALKLLIISDVKYVFRLLPNRLTSFIIVLVKKLRGKQGLR